MSHPGNLIQKAIFDTLTGYAPLATAMGGTTRVYDRVPTKPVFPYITIGDEQKIDDGNGCDDDVFEIYFDVHVWSEAVGLPQTKAIAALAYDAFKSGLTVPGWRVVSLKFETERHFRDADGIRGHGVLTFKTYLETA
jgi:hypothetical protein